MNWKINKYLALYAAIGPIVSLLLYLFTSDATSTECSNTGFVPCITNGFIFAILFGAFSWIIGLVTSIIFLLKQHFKSKWAVFTLWLFSLILLNVLIFGFDGEWLINTAGLYNVILSPLLFVIFSYLFSLIPSKK